MADPMAVAQAIGGGSALAVVAFLVTRKVCGPAGARHLARLQRLAGEEVQESGLSPYARDWLPYAAALFAGVVGALFGFPEAGLHLRRSFTAGDMPQLLAGFKNGCQRSCSAQRDASFCRGLCDCVFSTLRSRHPSDDAFAAWMQAGPENMTAVRAAVLEAQQQCSSGSQLPAPSGGPQGASSASLLEQRSRLPAGL